MGKEIPTAIVELRAEWFYLGLWFVYAGKPQIQNAGDTPVPMDCLAAAWREREGGSYTLVWRFRYYDDPTGAAFDSTDRKSSYRAVAAASADPEELVAGITEAARAVAARMGSRYVYLPVNGDGLKASEILMQQDFANMMPAKEM